MAILPIVTIDSPTIRKKSKKVVQLNSKHRRLLKDMIDTMRMADGVGIAAPQVGVNLRMAIVIFRKHGKEEKPLAIINPEILNTSDEFEVVDEGCLSVPGIFGPTPRHQEIQGRYLGLDGIKHTISLRGFNARVFQHEVDHLDGILFLDRVTDHSRMYRVDKKDHGSGSCEENIV